MEVYLKGQFITLYKDPDRISHEFACDLQYFIWKGGRD